MKKKIRKVSKFNKSHICKTDREIIEEFVNRTAKAKEADEDEDFMAGYKEFLATEFE